MFDYKSLTRNAYKSSKIARTYHNAFSGPVGWHSLRFKVIASLERRAVADCLSAVDVSTLLDLPCGTGKLASVVAGRGMTITAADISPHMLEIARESYVQAGHKNVGFLVVDAEKASVELGMDSVDLVVCLRLMHRVPSSVREKILHQISQVAPWAIISFGVDSRFQRVRRFVRNCMFGGGTERLCTASFDALTTEVSKGFEIKQVKWVLRGISGQVVFLLRRTDAGQAWCP